MTQPDDSPDLSEAEALEAKPVLPWYIPAAVILFALLCLFHFDNGSGGGSGEPLPAGDIVTMMLVMEGLFLLPILACRRFFGSEQPAAQEFMCDDLPDAILPVSLFITSVTFLFFLGITHITVQILEPMGFVPQADFTIPLIKSAPLPYRIMMIAIVTILIPVVEELVFRFVLYRSLRTILSHVPAMLAVAGFFAVVHGFIFPLPGLFCLSIILQESLRRSKNLYLPILIHGQFNSLMLILPHLLNAQ